MAHIIQQDIETSFKAPSLVSIITIDINLYQNLKMTI